MAEAEGTLKVRMLRRQGEGIREIARKAEGRPLHGEEAARR